MTRNIWIAGICGLAVNSAAALSLGEAHGQVLLGRPIDVSFDVHLDPGMTLEAACLVARIDSGENRLGQGQVDLTPLPPVPGRSPAVRVQSFRLADEPVLTVHLSVGCTGTITRSYVFLVDLPDSIPPSTLPIAIPWVAPEARPAAAAAGVGTDGVPGLPARQTGVPVAPEAARPAQPVAQAPVVVESAAPPKVRPAQAPASAPTARPRPAKAPVAAASRPPPTGPRLVMEPLSVVLTPAAGASAAAAAPAGTASEAAQGSALAPAQDASAAQPGASEAVPPPQAMQDELAALRMQAASDRAAALVLQQRLERIEAERFHPGVVYGLLGLLAVMLAWIVWQVLRFRTVFEQSSQAWSESVASHERTVSRRDD